MERTRRVRANAAQDKKSRAIEALKHFRKTGERSVLAEEPDYDEDMKSEEQEEDLSNFIVDEEEEIEEKEVDAMSLPKFSTRKNPTPKATKISSTKAGARRRLEQLYR
eukprot:TRINITY_DN7668_c0_g2_i1.p1 TRINITY_DN7668_c0_g2~~TRINITY_DN7668_c0_g2_i1.p1  ORF type:complete len:108 (+),score=30.86 TRINITY_DN7668_c0_g2_i1:45-368(+)